MGLLLDTGTLLLVGKSANLHASLQDLVAKVGDAVQGCIIMFTTFVQYIKVVAHQHEKLFVRLVGLK